MEKRTSHVKFKELAGKIGILKVLAKNELQKKPTRKRLTRSQISTNQGQKLTRAPNLAIFLKVPQKITKNKDLTPRPPQHSLCKSSLFPEKPS